jgi:hypothetical protein
MERIRIRIDFNKLREGAKTMTYYLWLNSLFEVTLELDGHLNRFDSRTIHLFYNVGIGLEGRRKKCSFKT